MENRRNVSILIPYKIENKEIFVYLQKREKDRKVLPDYFAFFGGGIENEESPEYAMLREISEEMCFIPKGYEFLGKYNFTDWSTNVYFLGVDKDFEKKVKIMEGDYGKFFSEEEVLNEPMMIQEDKNILRDLYKLLRKNEM